MEIGYKTLVPETGADIYLYMDFSIIHNEYNDEGGMGTCYIYGKKIDGDWVGQYRNWVRRVYAETVREIVGQLNLKVNLLAVTIMGLDPYRMTDLTNDRSKLLNCIHENEFCLSKDSNGKMHVNNIGSGLFNPYEEIYSNAVRNKMIYPERKAVGIVIVQSTDRFSKKEFVETIEKCAAEKIDIITIGLRDKSAKNKRLIRKDEAEMLSTDKKLSIVSDYAGALNYLKNFARIMLRKGKGDREKFLQQIQRQQSSCRQYDQELRKFEVEYKDLPEIRLHRSKVRDLEKKKDELIWKNERDDLSLGWIFGFGVPGLFLFFFEYMGEWLLSSNTGGGEIAYGLGLVITFITFFISVCIMTNQYMEHAVAISLLVASAIGGIMMYISGALMNGMIYICEHFYGRMQAVQIAGAAILVLAVLLIVKKAIGEYRIRTRREIVRRLWDEIRLEYEEIEKIISYEYKKIYEKYANIGLEREEVMDVRARLLNQIKDSSVIN